MQGKKNVRIHAFLKNDQNSTQTTPFINCIYFIIDNNVKLCRLHGLFSVQHQLSLCHKIDRFEPIH